MLHLLPAITPRVVSRFALNTIRRMTYDPFAAKLQQAKSIQRGWLLNRIRLCRETKFGRDHGFSNIKSIDDYKKQVPINDYSYFEPYINSVAEGVTSALIPAEEKLVQFTITTGSTGVPKLNPVTSTWLKEYKRSWSVWGSKLFCDHPDKIGSKMIQMAGTWDMGTTKGGYQISMVSALLSKIQNPLLKPYNLLPEIINTIPDPVARHYIVLRLTILENVGWILLMNPGTMIRLAEIGDTYSDRLLKDIAEGTLTDQFDIPENVRSILLSGYLKASPKGAKKLTQIASTQGKLLPIDYWNQPVVGCWTSGTAGFQSKYLPEYYGECAMRDMGLITSEGRHTIPLADDLPAGVPAIDAGFYEFVPVENDQSAQGEAMEAHELIEGESYRLLMTTAAGYYRFDIGDIVKCRGFIGEAPLLEFIQKSERVGDLEGEKVTEHQVVEAAHLAAKKTGFTLSLITAVPRRLLNQQPRYDFLMEHSQVKNLKQAKDFLKQFDAELAKINFLWRARRNEGVLQSPHLLLLAQNEWSRHINAEAKRRGTGDYQYKHPGLVVDESWLNQFQVDETITL